MLGTAKHQIRAVYDKETIRVYQAFNDQIADSALAHGTFLSPSFDLQRMTWIKPSFLWMMYRSGWGYKEKNQRRILAIDISRDDFEWALAHSCTSRPDCSAAKELRANLKIRSPVIIQWDPERDIDLQPLPYRSIQVGLRNEAVHLYVTRWIRRMADVTGIAHSIHALLGQGKIHQAQAMLPKEEVYPFWG